MEDPDAVLFRERTGASNWAQGDALADGLQLERVSCFEVQLLAERSWDDNTAGAIHGGLHDT
jgi:hypothetical protein